IAVVDADGSSLSRLITQQLDLSEMAEVQSAPNLTNAKYQLHIGAVQGYLYLEKGLEKKVLSLEQAHAVLAMNTSRFLPSSDLLSTITRITLTAGVGVRRSEEHTSELQSRFDLVCRLLLEKKNITN